VATPKTSAHVSGDAIDIGPTDAASWLAQHGAGYGLCRVYANEAWHYELRPDAATQGCPPLYADATQDPRMQRWTSRSTATSSTARTVSGVLMADRQPDRADSARA
jgi:hypothetical protein